LVNATLIKVSIFSLHNKGVKWFIFESFQYHHLISNNFSICSGVNLYFINFDLLKIKFLSFEYIHLGNKEIIVKEYLKNNNFKYIGTGVDHNGFDYLYKKIL
jgi:hypothetical protein